MMQTRSWEVWKNMDGYEKYYLEVWGPPNDIDKWRQGHKFRLRKALSLLVGESVLDVGCGMGHLYHLLEDRIQYTGVDNAQKQIEYARHFFPEADFRIGDTYDLSGFPMADTVYAISVLLHLPDLIEPLKQLLGRARKAVVFDMYIGDKTEIKTDNNNDVIYHYYEKEELLRLCKSLEKVEKTEFYLCGVTQENGENSCYIRLWRKQ